MSAADRDRRREAFLRRTGWEDAARRPLPDDASFRRYIRLRRDGARAMLMDAPPETENVRPYITVARALAAAGLSAPAIHAVDEADGFALIEDFGDATFTRLLDDGADPRPLYECAVDALAHLHATQEAAETPVPRYDETALLDEAMLLVDWYLPAVAGRSASTAERTAYRAAWRTVLRALPPVRQGLVLRDYHVDNLMLLAHRKGAAACGLLDFQDAAIGPCAYDLVSLLEDARRDVSDDLAVAMRARYARALPQVADASFERWYAVLGAQRHCKVAGIFVRLHARDRKPDYLAHIPRVLRLLARALDHPDLTPMAEWFAAHMPAFDPARFSTLPSTGRVGAERAGEG